MGRPEWSELSRSRRMFFPATAKIIEWDCERSTVTEALEVAHDLPEGRLDNLTALQPILHLLPKLSRSIL